MVDQAEIHRDVVSVYAETRIESASQLRDNFVVLPDKEQAWNDLHRLTDDNDRYVRLHATDALGYAFPHVPDREQAFNDLHRLTGARDVDVRLHAADALRTAFPYVTDKIQAWNDLHRLTKDEYPNVRLHAADALRTAFPHVPDREQAWNDLLRLTEDEGGDVRLHAAVALGYAFPHVPDREQAWNDLHRLTEDEDQYVRRGAAVALGYAFPHVPDREQAWNDLHSLTNDKCHNVRRSAADALRIAFPHVTDKTQAWNDLHRMTKDKYHNVRFRVAYALGYAFPHVTDKIQAWNDVHRLTVDNDRDARLRSAVALGYAFPHVPDREQAWNDLRRLTKGEDRDARSHAAYALGYAFPHVPDREQAWNDLRRLTGDEDSDVRASANHSLGRAFIFKATDAESEEEFRKEIENALTFFERSSKEVSYFNPSKFCLPFYRSFHAITFEGAGADEVQKYLADAKSASEGAESKEVLFEAVENLANALSEAHNLTDFDATKSNLNAYRQYCDRAADLIGDAEEKAPGAAGVLRRGLPIIDEQIKELLGEVKEKAEIFCDAADRPESELACRIKQHAAAALATNNPVIVDRVVDNIIREFEKHISSITNETGKEYVQKSVTDAKNNDLMGKLLIITSLVAASPSFFKDRGEKMPKYEIKNSVVNIAEGDGISQSIHSSTNSQKDLSQNNAEAPKPFKESKKSTVPFLSDLESEICDIFKSVYQKERNEDASEVNSKTLEFLKYKLLDLTASGKRIDWLDVGCGDGRSLDVLDAVQNRDNIRYHGIDSSYKYLDNTEKRARKYKLNPRLDKIDAAAMKFDSEYDVVSAVLLLHEIDPLCLPYILRNMLQALRGEGTLIISDFQGPYEQEEGVVAWGAEDIQNLLEKIGGARMGIEFVPSSQYPDELGFYRCYVKKPGLDREKFSDLLQGYDNFLDAKKEESKWQRGELRSQIEERVRKLLNRPDIDLKNISPEEMQRIQTEIGDEYGIKAHKIRLLTNQIEFLDDKIKEFRSGVGCDGTDQRTP
jgi:HEAT repeat protein/SAM-dependent methyltransferase